MPPPLTTSNHLSFGHRPSAIAGLATSCPNFPRVFQAQANHRSTANHSHCSNASQPWLTLRAELNALMFVRPILVHPIPREQACLPAAPASNTRRTPSLQCSRPSCAKKPCFGVSRVCPGACVHLPTLCSEPTASSTRVRLRTGPTPPGVPHLLHTLLPTSEHCPSCGVDFVLATFYPPTISFLLPFLQLFSFLNTPRQDQNFSRLFTPLTYLQHS